MDSICPVLCQLVFKNLVDQDNRLITSPVQDFLSLHATSDYPRSNIIKLFQRIINYSAFLNIAHNGHFAGVFNRI